MDRIARFRRRAGIVDGVMLVIGISVIGCAPRGSPSAICAIDMGSNSFRRIVGSFADGRYVETQLESITTGVGDDVTRHGRISDGKLAEITDTLAGFHASCQKDGVTTVVAVGTAAFRDAPNGSRAVETASRLGIKMEIASEHRESELAYLVGSLGRDGYAVIDNGSRSVELVAKDTGPLHYLVFNLGYRVAYEEFFAAAEDPAVAYAALRDRLLQQAAKAPFMSGKKTLVGLEFAEMADVLFEPAPIEGRVFTMQALRQRLDQITSDRGAFQSLKAKKDIDRALPRLVVAAVLTEALGYSQIELTGRQLGAGLIIEAALRP